MSIISARNSYLGKEGSKKVNCAQAIICAFKEKFGFTEEEIEAYKVYGGGKAPEGLCGALYASKQILAKYINKEKAIELEQFFMDQAGAMKCHEVRSGKKLSCLECVEKSAEYIEKVLSQGNK